MADATATDWQTRNGIAEPGNVGSEDFRLAMIAGAAGKPSLVSPGYHNQHGMMIVNAVNHGRDDHFGQTPEQHVTRYAQERGLASITDTLSRLIAYNDEGRAMVAHLMRVAADAVAVERRVAA